MKKKIVSICLAVALLALSVAGTLAYFTDTTDKVQNTFTVGKVDITLTESSPAQEGFIQGVVGTNAIDYKNIMPGQKLSKQPIIKVEDDSQPCYVFAELIVNGYDKLYAALEAAGIDATQLDNLLIGRDLGTGDVIDAWMSDDKTFHIVFTKGVMNAGATWTLFDGIQVPAEFEQDDCAALGTVGLDVIAYAVQEAEVADIAAAWKIVDPVQE